jgi:hypothetical protein
MSEKNLYAQLTSVMVFPNTFSSKLEEGLLIGYNIAFLCCFSSVFGASIALKLADLSSQGESGTYLVAYSD